MTKQAVRRCSHFLRSFPTSARIASALHQHKAMRATCGLNARCSQGAGGAALTPLPQRPSAPWTHCLMPRSLPSPSPAWVSGPGTRFMGQGRHLTDSPRTYLTTALRTLQSYLSLLWCGRYKHSLRLL